MKKQILLAGFLGGIVMFLWLFISNAMVPIKSNLIHKIAPNQLVIHQALKDNITEPGTYSCPYLSRAEEARMPDYRNQPVYSITYSGYTHGSSASGTFFLPIILIFIIPTIAAWMLSGMSDRILSKYPRKVLFIVAIGVIIALFDDTLQMSFGPQPRDYLMFLAINHVITWTLAALVIAWRVKPANSTAT